MKRSQKVSNYSGKWNVVAGYLDDPNKDLCQIVLNELREEANIEKDNIGSIKYANHYNYFDKEINKTWIIFPVLIKILDKSEVKLDWEHLKSKWINPSDLTKFNIVSGLEITFSRLLNICPKI